MKNLLAVFSVV